MEVLIAIGYIAGATLVAFNLVIAEELRNAYVTGQRTEIMLDQLPIDLGIPMEELLTEANAPKTLEYLSTRFSNEELKNRFSDLCGTLLVFWVRLGRLLNIGILIGVAWLTVTENLHMAAWAWLVIPSSLITWLTVGIFSRLCHFFTTRFPGQAKSARERIVDMKNGGLDGQQIFGDPIT
jgi:hypothetical protein